MKTKIIHGKKTLLCAELGSWNCEDCKRSLCRLDQYTIKNNEIETVATVIQ